MKPLKFAVLAPFLLAVSACASLPAPSAGGPPSEFADTRLQYALLAGEDAVLEKDFGMKLPPSWAERAAAGVALPFTVATETVFFPFSYAIKTWAPAPR